MQRLANKVEMLLWKCVDVKQQKKSVNLCLRSHIYQETETTPLKGTQQVGDGYLDL